MRENIDTLSPSRYVLSKSPCAGGDVACGEQKTRSARMSPSTAHCSFLLPWLNLFFFIPTAPLASPVFFLHPAPFSVFIVSFCFLSRLPSSSLSVSWVCVERSFSLLRCFSPIYVESVYNVASSGFSLDRDTVPLRASHAVEHISSST